MEVTGLGHRNFEIAAGSMIGRDHREVPKNSHDCFVVVRNDLCTIGVVADGCGSGAHSEVGAKLGARLLAEAILREVNLCPSLGIDWQNVREDMLADLEILAHKLGDSLRKVVSEFFLFTLVGVCLTDERAIFFAIGDGVVVVNGDTHLLLAGEGNKPAYLSYGLLSGQVDVEEDETYFKVIADLRIEDLEHFLLGTDGVVDLMRASEEYMPGTSKPVGGIEQFWEQDRYYNNPELVNRQLKLAARDWPRRDPSPGLLPDDTTLIAGRRKITTT